jgi:hypothetical protein
MIGIALKWGNSLFRINNQLRLVNIHFLIDVEWEIVDILFKKENIDKAE